MRNVEILTQTNENILSLSELKDYLSINTTDNDTLLGLLLDASSDFVKDYTGYQWVETEYKEIIDGGGTNSIVLSQRPVSNVDTLSVDGNTVESDDFVLYKEEAIITRKNQNFTEDLQNVEVIYTAGYSDIPEHLKKAVSELVKYKQNNGEYEGMEAYSIGDEDIQFSKENIPSDIKSILDSKSKKRW